MVLQLSVSRREHVTLQRVTPSNAGVRDAYYKEPETITPADSAPTYSSLLPFGVLPPTYSAQVDFAPLLSIYLVLLL